MTHIDPERWNRNIDNNDVEMDCPNCSGYNLVKYGNPVITRKDGMQIAVHVSCDNCKSEWYQLYKYTESIKLDSEEAKKLGLKELSNETYLCKD